MIVVLAELDFAPADAQQAAAALTQLAQGTRREPGCLEYAIALDLDEPGRLRLSELWSDRAALDAHFKTAHMADFRARVAPLRRLRTSARVVEATKISDLFAPAPNGGD